MKIFAIVFMLPFVAVPLFMMAMLWGESGFGGPPLFMKLAGTCICLAVMSGGLFGMYSIVTGKANRFKLNRQTGSFNHGPTAHRERGDYSCPHCGAAISTEAEISPSGDVKCPYCKSWFNVNK